MTVSAEVLRELHRIHRQLADLRERLDRGPRQIKAREANVQQCEAALEAARENVKQTKKTADQKQLDLKSGEGKIEDLKAKLNACSSNTEYQSFLEQIAAAEMANSVLADEILEGLEKVDTLEVEVDEEKKKLEASKTDLSAFRDKIASELELVRGDITRLDGELADVEKKIPADAKTDYVRVIRSKGADGMSEAQDQVCLACGNQMTLNMHNELLLSKPVFCKSCGCLLYLGES